MVENLANSGKSQLILPPHVVHLQRPNSGMNLGAWKEGMRQVNASHYLLLQDECYLKNIKDGRELHQQLTNEIRQNPRCELFGVSWNERWDKEIDVLRSFFQTQETLLDQLDDALKMCHDFGIPILKTLGHYRTLAILMKKEAAEILTTLVDGHSRQRCISEEIIWTKLVEVHGGPHKTLLNGPFKLIGHSEWSNVGRR